MLKARLKGLMGKALGRIPAAVRVGPSLEPGWPAGHFYSPVPSRDEIRRREAEIFAVPPTVPGIDLNEDGQLALLREIAGFHDELPFGETPAAPLRFGYDNPNFSYGEAAILFGMMRRLKPSRIVEIGSGHSTCLMVDTNRHFFGGGIELTAIEPYPELLRSLLGPESPAPLRVLAKPLQDVDPAVFEALGPGDILFVDSSHVSKAGSDVNRIVFEILPALRRGVFIHFHDIYYPFEYPKAWLLEGRYWTEAYLLRAFLQYNRVFRIELFGSYLGRFRREALGACLPIALKNPGSSLWLCKV
jgi:hypothetical protein